MSSQAVKDFKKLNVGHNVTVVAEKPALVKKVTISPREYINTVGVVQHVEIRPEGFFLKPSYTRSQILDPSFEVVSGNPFIPDDIELSEYDSCHRILLVAL